MGYICTYYDRKQKNHLHLCCMCLGSCFPTWEKIRTKVLTSVEKSKISFLSMLHQSKQSDCATTSFHLFKHIQDWNEQFYTLQHGVRPKNEWMNVCVNPIYISTANSTRPVYIKNARSKWWWPIVVPFIFSWIWCCSWSCSSIDTRQVILSTIPNKWLVFEKTIKWLCMLAPGGTRLSFFAFASTQRRINDLAECRYRSANLVRW